MGALPGKNLLHPYRLPHARPPRATLVLGESRLQYHASVQDSPSFKMMCMWVRTAVSLSATTSARPGLMFRSLGLGQWRPSQTGLLTRAVPMDITAPRIGAIPLAQQIPLGRVGLAPA